MDVLDINRRAWDAESAAGGTWSRPVGPDVIARARAGDWSIILTPNAPVPAAWFPPLDGARVLGLASAGGQQCPVLAAAGAQVTSFDLSGEQLARDREVAERDGLQLETVQGDMADLSAFADESFDLVVNPVSVCFAPHVRPIWREAARVLRPGGRLMTGFGNPAMFLFDEAEEARSGLLVAAHSLPRCDASALEGDGALGRTVDFSHTLTDLIGGQLAAGLRLIDFYEDDWNDEATILNRHMKLFIATLAEKPGKDRP